MTFSIEEIIGKHRWFIMGLATLSVVLFHQPWFDRGVFGFFQKYGHFGVEVFFFISGWGVYHSLQTNNVKQYFVNRANRMVPTCILVGIMQAILDLLGMDDGIDHPWKYYFLCIGLFKWFVVAIWLFYIIAPLVYVSLKRHYTFVVFVLIYLMIFVMCHHCDYLHSGNLISIIPHLLSKFPAFLYGMWIAYIRPTSHLFLYLSVLSLLSFSFLLWKGYSYPYNYLVDTLLFSFSVPCLCFFVFFIDKGLFVYKMIEEIGRFSLEVYLWHVFFFTSLHEWSFASLSPVFLQSFIAIFATVVMVFLTKKILILIKF